MFPEIVQQLKDPFDYSEYEKTEVNPMTMATYAQKLGMLMVARKAFPGVSDQESLQKMKERMNNDFQKSSGLGDTVAKITHATGLDKLSELYTQITGKPCGCKERQEALNKLFPYGIKEEG